MKNVKKIVLAASLCAAMVATAAFGTLAYFTDTDAETNVFTAGNLKIELDEPSFEENRHYDHLVPGTVVAKDPIVLNKDNTDAYVQMELKLPTALFNYSNLSENANPVIKFDIDTANWHKVGGAVPDGDNMVLTYYYGSATNYGVVVAGSNTSHLFTKIDFTKDIDNDVMDELRIDENDFEIVVNAKAIQTTGLNSEASNMNSVFATTEFKEAK